MIGAIHGKTHKVRESVFRIAGRLSLDDCPVHARVLDIGCGPGNVTSYLRRRYPERHLQLYGLDCSQEMLKIARKVDPQTVRKEAIGEEERKAKRSERTAGA